MLKDTTERVLSEIKTRNGWAPGDNVRMIFHTYKPLKNIGGRDSEACRARSLTT
jgi:hypothetical protein